MMEGSEQKLREWTTSDRGAKDPLGAEQTPSASTQGGGRSSGGNRTWDRGGGEATSRQGLRDSGRMESGGQGLRDWTSSDDEKDDPYGLGISSSEPPVGANLFKRGRRRQQTEGGSEDGSRRDGGSSWLQWKIPEGKKDQLLSWVLLLGCFALVCVALRNYSNQQLALEQELRRNVGDRHRESVEIGGRLMRQSRETQVSLLVQARGLSVQESRRPPMVVKLQER